MSNGSKNGSEDLGKNADGNDGKTRITSFKEAIEQEAARTRESEVDPSKTDQASPDKDSIDRIFISLSELPYDKLQEITKYPGFELSKKEKDLNGMLLTCIVMFYLPNIDLGKFALWAFIILNIALLIEKTVIFLDYKKKEKEKGAKTTQEDPK